MGFPSAYVGLLFPTYWFIGHHILVYRSPYFDLLFTIYKGESLNRCQQTPYLSKPSSLPTLIKAAIHLSSCSVVWAAESCTRMRASPFGTTG